MLDLVGLGLTGVKVEDEDIEIGAATPLQDIVDSPVAYSATAGFLPAACRAAVPSRLLRGNKLARVRLAVTGLTTPPAALRELPLSPARVLDALAARTRR